MTSEISVSFNLTGLDFNPDDLTNKLGINPTKIWRIGDLIHPKTILKRKENGWSLQSQLDKNHLLEEHIKYILNQLESKRNFLQEICSKNYGELSCIIYAINKERPSIHLDQDIIKKVHQLNCEIDIDLYFLPDEINKNRNKEIKQISKIPEPEKVISVF
jgi:hypothetical protein